MPTITEKYKNLREQKLKLQEEVSKMTKVYFAEASKHLFDTHPDLESFSWQQYTPYFNDGDTCTFSVYSDYPTINGDNDYDRFTRELNEKYTNPDYDPKKAELYDAVKDFIQGFDQDDLFTLFGDHCSILVTRHAVSVDTYDHD